MNCVPEERAPGLVVETTSGSWALRWVDSINPKAALPATDSRGEGILRREDCPQDGQSSSSGLRAIANEASNPWPSGQRNS